jgi:membrane protease YdiL (CAAX protease family)
MSDIQKSITHEDKPRALLTLALGMLVLLWRVILPREFAMSWPLALAICALDIALAAAIVWLNRKYLKKVFEKKFTGKDWLKVLGGFVIVFLASVIGGLLIVALGGEDSVAPAQQVGLDYSALFPIGAIISIVITAPIWEELAFRYAGRKLFKNKILYVIIPTLLFAFIHTVNFSLIDNLSYLVFGAGLALIYLWFKDIRINMLVHFLWNIMAVAAMIFNK